MLVYALGMGVGTHIVDALVPVQEAILAWNPPGGRTAGRGER
jgi:hypothetical protein